MKFFTVENSNGIFNTLNLWFISQNKINCLILFQSAPMFSGESGRDVLSHVLVSHLEEWWHSLWYTSTGYPSWARKTGFYLYCSSPEKGKCITHINWQFCIIIFNKNSGSYLGRYLHTLYSIYFLWQSYNAAFV